MALILAELVGSILWFLSVGWYIQFCNPPSRLCDAIFVMILVWSIAQVVLLPVTFVTALDLIDKRRKRRR
jgi:hypothetical protein